MSIVAVESYLWVSECGIVAAAALLAFDYCLTFGREVEWVYGTKWTVARIHFASLRYLPFVAIAMGISTSLVRPPQQANYCGTLGTATNVVYYLCVILTEAMLVVRTYAFWKRDRRILVGMCTTGVVCMVTAIVVSETLDSRSTNLYKTLNCPGTESIIATAVQYACLILYEMGMLCSNWIAFRRMKRHNTPSPLIMTLYRDGIIYVAVILVFSVINAVVTVSAPVKYSDILNSPQTVMHSILASRIFFNLRETTRREQGNPLESPLSEFHATAPQFSEFSNALGSSRSSSDGIDPTTTVDATEVIEVVREDMV